MSEFCRVCKAPVQDDHHPDCTFAPQGEVREQITQELQALRDAGHPFGVSLTTQQAHRYAFNAAIMVVRRVLRQQPTEPRKCQHHGGTISEFGTLVVCLSCGKAWAERPAPSEPRQPRQTHLEQPSALPALLMLVRSLVEAGQIEHPSLTLHQLRRALRRVEAELWPAPSVPNADVPVPHKDDCDCDECYKRHVAWLEHRAADVRAEDNVPPFVEFDILEHIQPNEAVNDLEKIAVSEKKQALVRGGLLSAALYIKALGQRCAELEAALRDAAGHIRWCRHRHYEFNPNDDYATQVLDPWLANFDKDDQ